MNASIPISASTGRGNPVALSVLASLFFMLGFVTCLNDVLIPHLKEVFYLSNREAMLTQTAFFSAYAIMSFLAGKVIDKIGYKGTVITGFLITALGAFLFYMLINPCFLLCFCLSFLLWQQASHFCK